jgi:hypothetical protein
MLVYADVCSYNSSRLKPQPPPPPPLLRQRGVGKKEQK